MIGQDKNIKLINNFKKNKNLPQFLVVLGSKGSGRLTLCKEIAKELNLLPVIVLGSSVEAIRSIISSAYTNTNEVLYIIKNGSNLSRASQNALLKVTEEPPNNSHFILILEKEYQALNTIKSRAFIITMEKYSKKELSKVTDDPLYLENCETIGQLEYWQERKDLKDFIQFVNKVANNLVNSYGTDILQISKKLNLKEDKDSYLCIYFIKLFFKNILENVAKSKNIETKLKLINLTNKCLHQMEINSLRKESILDLYLLEVKNILLEE